MVLERCKNGAGMVVAGMVLEVADRGGSGGAGMGVVLE
jgi:hypothetical protein